MNTSPHAPRQTIATTMQALFFLNGLGLFIAGILFGWGWFFFLLELDCPFVHSYGAGRIILREQAAQLNEQPCIAWKSFGRKNRILGSLFVATELAGDGDNLIQQLNVIGIETPGTLKMSQSHGGVLTLHMHPSLGEMGTRYQQVFLLLRSDLAWFQKFGDFFDDRSLLRELGGRWSHRCRGAQHRAQHYSRDKSPGNE